MKNKIILLSAIAALALSCQQEELLYVQPESLAVSLVGPADDIVLQEAEQDALALSLNWKLETELSGIALNSVKFVLQFSDAENFENMVEKSVNSANSSVQYTVKELNIICQTLALAPAQPCDLHIRLASKIGDNTEPVYSNVLSLKVTSYASDMSTGVILDKNMNETDKYLYSAEQNGIYSGFLGVDSWYNCYFKAPDGAIWGVENVNWTPFVAGKDELAGNFWFPEPSGCYYTTVNTVDATPFWSALYIPSIIISGDIEGEMSFIKSACAWTYSFESASAGTLNILLSAEGQLYDPSTGDKASIAKNVGFAGSCDDLSFGETASAISVNVNAGSVTLILDLKDPAHWSLSQGEVVASGPAPYLYILGAHDTYDFDEYLTLYDEDNLAYAAMAYMNSSWGWYFCQEKDNWEKTGYAEDGKLVVGGTEIPGPGVGLYLVQASLKEMSYSTTAFENKAWLTGLNDDWTLVPMEETETLGVFTSVVSVTSGSTPWGFKVYLDDAWGEFFGCTAEGTMLYSKDGKALDASYDGTYLLTVNLRNCTWQMDKQ
ncbi:MAG: DUF5114 domain-containing protein [Candidatus Cryptobacteroides sp.]